MTGKEFRKWRRSLEISQQVVASFVKCNKSTICRWEKEQMNLYPDLYQKVMDFYETNQNASAEEFGSSNLSYGQICPKVTNKLHNDKQYK